MTLAYSLSTIITGGDDKQLHLWNIEEDEGSYTVRVTVNIVYKTVAW